MTHETSPVDPPAPVRRRRGRIGIETLLLLVVALVLAVVVKTFLVQAFVIPSISMEPTLVRHDRILVEKPSYSFGGTPARGDIVVFADPGDWLPADEQTGPSGPLTTALSKVGLYPTGGHLVKRVIGVGGDTVHCCNAQGEISVDGTYLDETSFIAPQTACDGPMIPSCRWTVTVPARELFVMGDNRDDSGDSSAHLGACRVRTNCPDAFIPTDLVVGKVFALVYPVGRLHVFHRPAVFATIPGPS